MNHHLENPEPGWSKRISQAAVLLGIIGFAAALVGFAYTGTFTRYWADDYCYNAVLNADGFWKAQVSFYLYTSDRYSVIPLVGISEVFGAQAIRYWPLLAIVLGAGSLAWALGPLGQALGRPFGRLERLLLGEIVTFFTLWQAPNLFQVLYWRTGMITYYLPLVALVILVGWIALRSTRGPTPAWMLGLIGLLAFFAGGFSETNAAVQAGALGLALAAAWIGMRLGATKAARWLPALVSALAGTVIAMVVLFVSPSNALRMQKMPESAGLGTIVALSLRFGLDFITDTFSSQPLPTGVSILVALALGMVHGSQDPQPGNRSWKGFIGLLLAAGLGSYLLLVCVMAPSVYVEVAYPEYRALIAARFAMTVGLVALGWLVGEFAVGLARRRLAERRLPFVWLAAGSALMLVVFSLYSLRAAQVIYTEIPAHRQRAETWDARDREIRQKRDQGEQDIVVTAMDSVYGLMEFQPGKNQWPNNCAAGTYQVQSITGVNP